MTTPSGTITLDNVQTEFGGTNPIGINEYYAGGIYVSAFVSGVPTSSTIDMNSLRNKTKISISNDKSSVNEGDSVTFTVTTATVTNGTVFYWAAVSSTGTTAADAVGDSPLGSITINSNAATISLTMKLDTDTPETGEDFAIRFYYTQADRDAFNNNYFAQSNTVSINNATYSIAPAASNVNEGGNLTINVTTTNITNGTTFYWTINHSTTSTSDFSTNSGSFTITTNAGSFTVGPVADQVTEGAESFTVSMRPYSTSGVVLATTSSITINDTSITSPTATLSASPSSITTGTSSTLSWTTTNATSANINQGIGNVSVGSGSTTVSPTTTTTYTITPYNSVGTAGTTASATVTVHPAASSTLSASPGNITSGGSSTLSWTMTNSSLVFGGKINPGNISVSGSSGTVSVSPTSTTTYTITPYNAINVAGTTASTTVTVYAVASSTLSASPSSIYTGDSSTLSWTMTNADGGYGIINPGNMDVYGTSGTESVSPSSTTTYTITPYNALNSAGNAASATVTVTAPPTYYSVPQINSITWSPASVDEGNGITFTLSVTDNAYSGAPRNFYYASIGGYNTTAADFTDVGYGTLTSIDGTTTRTFTVYFAADQITEGTETFSIGIYSAGPYQGSPYYQTSFININDTSTTPSLTLTSIGFSPNPAYNGQGYTITVNQSGTSGSNNNITLILDQKAPNNFYESFGPETENQLITVNAGSTSGSSSSTLSGASLRHNAQLTASGSITSGGSVSTWAILGGNSSYMSYISFNVTNTNSALQNTVDTVVFLRSGQTLHFGTNNGTALSGTSYSGDTYIRLYSQSSGTQVDQTAGSGYSDDNGGGLGSYLTWTNNLGDGNYILKIGAFNTGAASGTAAYYFS